MPIRFIARWLPAFALLVAAGCIQQDPVHVAVKHLKDPSPSVRQQALEQLRPLHSKRAIEPVIACLQDPDPDVRAAAVATVTEWKEPQAVEPLGRCLQDPAPAVRLAAAQALPVFHDPRAIPPLIQALEADDAELRAAAATALGQIGDVRAIEPLLAAVTSKAPETAAAALAALGALHDPRALPAIIGALAAKDDSVGAQAVDAIARFGAPAVEPLLASLHDPKARVRARAAEALGRIGDARAVGPLVDLLKQAPSADPPAADENAPAAPKADTDESADAIPDVRQAAAEALGKLGAPAVEPLLGCLTADDATVCALAAKALGEIKDARAAEPLVAALLQRQKSGDSDARDALVAALVALGPPAVAPLAAHLQDDDIDIRRTVAEPLDGLKFVPTEDADKAAFWVLRKSWDDLVKLGAPAVAPLIAALKSDDNETQSGAAEALGKLGDRRAVDPLVVLLQNGAQEVTAKAAAALGFLGDPAAVEPLMKTAETAPADDTRAAAAEALGRLGDARATPTLVGLLKVSNADLRQAGAQALGKLDYAPKAPADQAAYLVALQSWDDAVKLGPPAFDALAAVLGDPNTDVRRGVIGALGKLGDARAVAPLNAALPDWEFNADLVASLEQLGWKPSNENEEVYAWISKKDADSLKGKWDQTRKVLLADVESSDRRKIENAVYSFVAIGEPKILDDLVKVLDDQGNTEIAETYLNSGNDQLDKAARAWAERNGYNVIPGSGAHHANWGSF
ncbi:MAG TPA: HEAT repeat domain-containing protein [Opitutaceae bacterium]|nr:HEAT repeat domain-containing protein [Opitutaceae bacterium]